MTEIMWSAVIPTAPPSAKNSRRIIRRKSKVSGGWVPGVIKSEAALGWWDLALHALARSLPPKPIEADVTLYAEIYYRDRRPDLCVALLMDVLQKAAVIKNDRQVRRIIAEGFVDKDNPRAVVALAPYAPAASIPLRASVRRAA